MHYSNLSKEERQKIFEEKLEKRYHGDFKLIGEYTDGRTSTEFLCKCGNITKCAPQSFFYTKKKLGCPKCCYDKRSNTRIIGKKEFLEKLKNLYPNNEFQLIEKYTSYTSETKFIHNKCGNEFMNKPENLVSTYRKFCPCCVNNTKLTIKDCKEKVKEMYPDGRYELISTKYKNNKEKLKFKCNICKNEFEMSWNNFSSDMNTCPHCIGHVRFPKEEYIRILKSIIQNMK